MFKGQLAEIVKEISDKVVFELSKLTLRSKSWPVDRRLPALLCLSEKLGLSAVSSLHLLPHSWSALQALLVINSSQPNLVE